MKSKKTEQQVCSLGELIAELYDEAEKVYSSPDAQKVVVYEALRHILSTRLRRKELRLAS